MRLKTFLAPTIADAMEQVRRELGPDAVIISTFQAKNGRGVEVRAAVERAIANDPAPSDGSGLDPLSIGEANLEPPPIFGRRSTTDPSLAGASDGTPRSGLSHDQLKKVLTFHGLSRELIKALLSACGALETQNPKDALERSLELRFAIETLPAVPTRPVMLVGGAGVGKTVTAAKLAARAVIADARPQLITTDTLRSGAVEQLRGLARKMGRTAVVADETDRLHSLLEPSKRNSKIARPVFIDTPACNPLSAQDLSDIKRFLDVGDIEPIAVVAAGSDAVDLAENLRAFAMLGVKRIIVTRLDAVRRIGSLLTAVDQTKHAFSLSSDSPYIGTELEHFTPSAIARRLLMVPNPASLQKSLAREQAAHTRTKVS